MGTAFFGAQHLQDPGGLQGIHHEYTSNREERKIHGVDLPQKLHVCKDPRISCVVDHLAILCCDDEAGRRPHLLNRDSLTLTRLAESSRE